MKKKYLVITYENRDIYLKYFDNYVDAHNYTYIAKKREKCYREMISYKRIIEKFYSEDFHYV